MEANNLDGINTLRYSDIFLAMYFNDGMSCLHRNHSHVLVYMYSGELEINEREKRCMAVLPQTTQAIDLG